MTRSFTAAQATMHEVPLLIGLEGPPAGGKTFSALRLAAGMRRVRPGPVVLIDTERGRASKYAKDFDFLTVPFDPPFKPTDFLAAIRAQLALKPACIIVDSLSDEHEGEGGVLDWHDACVGKFGGNEHAAWGPPKADRKRLIGGLLQIMTPVILTFRAREKTVQQRDASGKKEVVNIGFQPIAPAEIVYALDLVCLLPIRANGVPQWKSDKAGESFMTKLPNYLAPFLKDGVALNEDMGEAFARWAMGDAPVEAPPKGAPKPTTGAIDKWATDARARFEAAQTPHDLAGLTAWWNSPDNLKARERAHTSNPDLAAAVKAEFQAAVARLSSMEEVGT